MIIIQGKRVRYGTFIILLLVTILLAVTNPTKEDFSDYIVKEITGDSDGIIIKGIANSLGKTVIEAASKRDDYVLFSIFSVNGGESSSGKYLGFLNSVFITL